MACVRFYLHTVMNGVGLCLYELSMNYVFGENSLLCGRSDKIDTGEYVRHVIGFCAGAFFLEKQGGEKIQKQAD